MLHPLTSSFCVQCECGFTARSNNPVWRWVWSKCGCGRERGGEASGKQHQVSDWQSWHVLTNHGLPLNPEVCWTSDGSCRQDARDVIGPFELHLLCVECIEWKPELCMVLAEITSGSTGNATPCSSHCYHLLLRCDGNTTPKWTRKSDFPS